MINIATDSFNLESIRGVIFDKDGTITDANIYWSKIIRMRSEIIIQKYKLNEKLFPNICLSMGLNTKTNKLLPSGPIALKSRKEVIINLMKFLNLNKLDIYYEDIQKLFVEVNNNFSKIANEYISPIDPCIELIKELYRSEVRLSLVTSDTTSNASIACEKLNLTSYFDCILGGDLIMNNKSSGEPAIFACNQMKINKKDTVCIGDTEVDSQMARKANLKGSILVASGQVPFKKLNQFSSYCVQSLSEIEII